MDGAPDHLRQLAREGGNRVLFLGGGDATLAGVLAREVDKDVTYVDAAEDALEIAAARAVRHAVRSALEDDRWVEAVVGGQFDVIVLDAELDRLTDPHALLRCLHERRLLARDGFLVCRWEAGPDPQDLARTLLESEGFAVTRVLRHAAGSGLTLRAEPLGAGAAATSEEVARLRRVVRSLAAERDRAEQRADDLAARLNNVYKSPTWRAGRVVTGLPAAVRRRLR